MLMVPSYYATNENCLHLGYLLFARRRDGDPLNIGLLAQLRHLFLHGLNLGHHFRYKEWKNAAMKSLPFF